MRLALAKYLEDAEFKYTVYGYFKVIFYTLGIVVCLGIFLKHSLKRKRHLKLYPSRDIRFFDPWGHLRDLLGTTKVKGLNFNVYVLQVALGNQQLFKHENFFYFSFAYVPYLVLINAKAVEEFISGTKNIEKNWIYRFLHPWLGAGLLTSHGSKWKSRRKLLTPSFHFDILKDFLPVFDEQSQLLVKLLQKETKKPWTDIVGPITLCSLDIICETTLGVAIGAQIDSESKYVQAVSRAAEVLMKRMFYPPYYLDWCFYFSRLGSQFKRDVKLLHDFTRAVIAEKKQKQLSNTQEEKIVIKKRRALLDLLLDEHIKNNAFTEEDIREEVDTFAFEGHDTTSMGMSWALYLIGLYKDVQEKILEEIDRVFGDDCERPVTTDDLKHFEYLDRVLKESLRLYPSVPAFSRKLDQDIMLCGVEVPKEVGIMIMPYLLHRDERVFPNPEKFDPDRFLPENTAKRSPFAYIPFSAGPRNCIGQRFAMMELKVVIINILRHYILESLDPRDRVLPDLEIVLREAGPIRIKLRFRRPSPSK